MKKKFILITTIILAVVLSAALLTACDLFGGGNNDSGKKNSNNTDTTTLNQEQCIAEFNAAKTASLAKTSYSFYSRTSSGMGSTPTITNIEVGSDIIYIHTESRGVTVDYYCYQKDGKYYRASKVEDVYVAAEISSSDYDNAVNQAQLTAQLGGVSIDGTEPGYTATYSGTKEGKNVNISLNIEGTENGKRTVITETIAIQNGLITSFSGNYTPYSADGTPDIGYESTMTMQYDVTVTLPAELQ